MTGRPVRIEPKPGEESVWDYPRPPALVQSNERIRVEHRGIVIADSVRAMRVLETSQPPAYYLPRADVAVEHLRASAHRSMCEWKGLATYWSLQIGDEVFADVAWSYEDPTPPFAAILGHLAFYPRLLDHCSVDGELVASNAGDFYGGWITSRIVGPFKGAPGTLHW